MPFGGFTAARGGVLILVDSSCLKCLLTADEALKVLNNIYSMLSSKFNEF